MPNLKRLSRLVRAVLLISVSASLHAAPVPRHTLRVDRLPWGEVSHSVPVTPGDVIPPCEMVFDYRTGPNPTRFSARHGSPRLLLVTPRQHWTFTTGPQRR